MENQINIGDQSSQQVGQNSLSQPTTIQEKTRVNYWLILVVGFIFMVVGFTGGYLFKSKSETKPFYVSQPTPSVYSNSTPITEPAITEQPSATPRSNWKRFINTRFGYYFDYPNNWELNRGPGNLSDEELGKGRSVDVYGPLAHSQDPGTGFTVDTNELHQTGDLRNCGDIDDCISKATSYFPSDVTRSEEKFLGYSAKRISYDRSTPLYTQTFSHLFVMIGDNFYHFTMSSEKKSFQSNKTIFDQILDSFKLVE